MATCSIPVRGEHGTGLTIRYHVMIKNLFKYWTLQVFNPGAVIKDKYASFQSLLEKDKNAHELMAELEEIYYDQMPVDFNVIEDKYTQFSAAVGGMIADLFKICPGQYTALKTVHHKFDQYVRFMLVAERGATDPPYVVALDHRQALDESLVGGKAANLARASQDLQLPVPAGFAITTRAFHRLLAFNDLDGLIAARLASLDIYSGRSLADVSDEICRAIREATVPVDVRDAIKAAMAGLQDKLNYAARLAVRSSAKGEDSKTSFAGQYQTVLNVGEPEMVNAYKQVLASKYSPPALVYRINYGLSDREVPMAVLVVEMIAAAASGVMVTREPAETTDNRLSIHAVWGLGQPLVDGQSVPAVYQAAKTDPPVVVFQRPHHQTEQRVFDPDQGLLTRALDEVEKQKVPIEESTALKLTEWGQLLESHFGRTQDVEWCLSDDNRLVLLQTRPFYAEPTHQASGRLTCTFDPVDNAVLVSGGQTAAAGIAAGKTVAITGIDDLANVPDGSVLVTRSIPPDFAAAVNRLHAVVAEAGSCAGHFASVAREFGIPTIVNAADALRALPEGIDVTVDAENGTVYRGVVQAMVDSPCARRNLLADSPFMKRLGAVMSFISTLELVDPGSVNFAPEGCRSHHDIVRFVHEKAVAAMFQLSNIRLRKVGGSRKLTIGIPMLFYAIDVGGGLTEGASDQPRVGLTDIASVPLRALFKGLTHPDIQWGAFSHFDWAAHDKVVMSGGSINPDSAMFASHVIISDCYANLNLRFGYHFVVLDTVCTDEEADNYILLRFSGGGADIEKRRLRAAFLGRIFERLGFEVTRKSDLIDAKYGTAGKTEIAHTLDMVGRLLGATRLMDMYLKDETMVDAYADEFMQGRYHFSSVDL
jgi:pyruvate,water dikinase